MDGGENYYDKKIIYGHMQWFNLSSTSFAQVGRDEEKTVFKIKLLA